MLYCGIGGDVDGGRERGSKVNKGDGGPDAHEGLQKKSLLLDFCDIVTCPDMKCQKKKVWFVAMVCGYKEGPIPQDVLPSLHMYISHITHVLNIYFFFFYVKIMCGRRRS